MKMKMFVVYDCKTEAYLLPHFFRTRGEAMRAYLTACNDSSSNFCSSPSDYTFFEIGEYCDSSGVVSMHSSKVNLGTALELKTQTIKE